MKVSFIYRVFNMLNHSYIYRCPAASLQSNHVNAFAFLPVKWAYAPEKRGLHSPNTKSVRYEGIIWIKTSWFWINNKLIRSRNKIIRIINITSSCWKRGRWRKMFRKRTRIKRGSGSSRKSIISKCGANLQISKYWIKSKQTRIRRWLKEGKHQETGVNHWITLGWG